VDVKRGSSMTSGHVHVAVAVKVHDHDNDQVNLYVNASFLRASA
jgi:hypothetical protein